MFTDPGFLSAVKNTLILLAVIPSVTLILCLALSWLMVRARMGYTRSLDVLTLMPHAMPGVVFGFAYLWLFLIIPFIPIYGTIWIIILALVVSYLPFGTRMTNASMYQVAVELEEAASVSGASWLRNVRRVLLPLIAPALIGAWIFVAVFTVRDLPLPLILGTSDTAPLSVLLWNYWGASEAPESAAVGIIFMIFALGLLIIGRWLVTSSARRRASAA